MISDLPSGLSITLRKMKKITVEQQMDSAYVAIPYRA